MPDQRQDEWPVFPYGSASNPLASIGERCPACGGVVDADVAPPAPSVVRLAEASLAAEALAWWRSLCLVRCAVCGWIGSAFRPEEAIAA